jgi:hypothetical protein
MKLRKNIALSESGLIFNPSTGDSFSLNEVGQKIIYMLREGRAENAIHEQLRQEYQVADNTLTSDLQDFIEQLRLLNLLEHE